MLKIFAGLKGSGKTKNLIDMVNAAQSTTKGNVVCIEKGLKLTYDLTHRARLVNSEEYGIAGYEALYGFIAGMCAGNYDLTDIFVDATLRIGGRDYNEFADFIEKLAGMCGHSAANITFTVSCDEADIPAKAPL